MEEWPPLGAGFLSERRCHLRHHTRQKVHYLIPQRKQSVMVHGREWHFGIFGGHTNVGTFVLGGEAWVSLKSQADIVE